ncbi:hypothetical protein LD731_01360 [Lactobacillus delbrueckii subsp. delbrueckii]|uniref:hypothetical protein n=1 Tax=Lactobacillus delbrueckii TaxID=1584 RepID=UPI00090A1558|nr:hypothetical protein [Lactobacillus delbrueckii]APG70865.1 hypothetical protein LD731_01360 [Lactobacillus delbrueckii subsp. delbrueckii]BBL26968.1 hypothetical protein LDE01_02650 [Lactobacillus delbrueckii subsp. delbrueckii]GEA74340.1 hypothetical protein LDE03_01480 [Lactobacillus delbrueckii subsp. delbrueckii]
MSIELKNKELQSGSIIVGNFLADPETFVINSDAITSKVLLEPDIPVLAALFSSLQVKSMKHCKAKVTKNIHTKAKKGPISLV